MQRETFLALPTADLAAIVRQHGPVVAGFPINGTRRWFMLEHPPAPGDDPAQRYLAVMEAEHIAQYRRFFQHGVDTLLTPVFGPDLMERGPEYTAMAITGLRRLAEHPTFLDFYEEMSVRVGFYGDYARYLVGTPYADLTERFANITAQTRGNGPYRLFFGLFAHDPAERIAQLGIEHHAAQGQAPDRRSLIEAYYGEYIDPLSFFIGFDRFSFFDVPLLATGMEDLYFTVSPSLYLTERGLRAILYDHLFARRVEETDYQDLSAADFARMRDFYHANRDRTLGVGRVQERGRYWYPLPGVRLTAGFADEDTGQ